MSGFFFVWVYWCCKIIIAIATAGMETVVKTYWWRKWKWYTKGILMISSFLFLFLFFWSVVVVVIVFSIFVTKHDNHLSHNSNHHKHKPIKILCDYRSHSFFFSCFLVRFISFIHSYKCKYVLCLVAKEDDNVKDQAKVTKGYHNFQTHNWERQYITQKWI